MNPIAALRSFLAARRTRRELRATLQHLRLALRMREDIAPAADVAAAREAEAVLLTALRAPYTHVNLSPTLATDIETAADRLYPPLPHPKWRENIEVLVVALGLAMACRTYFVQPFKIPTGSMQPTLNGVLAAPATAPTWSDRLPFWPLKWLATGQRYKEIRAAASGRVTWAVAPDGRPAYAVAGLLHPLQLSLSGPATVDPARSMHLAVRPGDFVQKGDLLASGLVAAGDHVFVNRMAYHFRRPRRGEIVVFDTNFIPPIPDGTEATVAPDTYYIKRLVGLPGETVSIDPPSLLVDGSPVTTPPCFVKDFQDPAYYDGYLLRPDSLLRTPSDTITIPAGHFLPFGDNTRSSLDGRYFGPVSTRALVGPAFLVYWPFTPHFGPCH
jgi:signal peptidase I